MIRLAVSSEAKIAADLKAKQFDQSEIAPA
jgi:hypothetical protein